MLNTITKMNIPAANTTRVTSLLISIAKPPNLLFIESPISGRGVVWARHGVKAYSGGEIEVGVLTQATFCHDPTLSIRAR